MRRHPQAKLDSRGLNAGSLAHSPISRRGALRGKGSRGVGRATPRSFIPPERWYEPQDDRAACSGYRFVVQSAGEGFQHVITPDEIRDRLAQLPGWMTERLEVVQLSQMTRKKRSFPCYGMQWGTTIYIYPIEESLEEHFVRPPRPSQFNEARMYGGRWVQTGTNWKLLWSQSAIKDFYLNNILIHELGHLVDDRNSSYVDRERFAEWFAVEHGYKPTHRARLAARAVAKFDRLSAS